ncbi:hypothetical protein BASA50_001719 [Batrachochytrium salamandrivorans]|uniref:Secreted protein n=1 Tax=Batrachochytrium salamandrivorans TaxID=1357716 RepID=A0ABQ8FR47_9FUNG|nr:hypothetical protein BASA50_001719 [Batrachochytrium salamandrivorans]
MALHCLWTAMRCLHIASAKIVTSLTTSRTFPPSRVLQRVTFFVEIALRFVYTLLDDPRFVANSGLESGCNGVRLASSKRVMTTSDLIIVGFVRSWFDRLH